MGLIDRVRMSAEDLGFEDICTDMMRNGTPYAAAYHGAYRIAYRSHFRKARRPLGVMLALECGQGGPL
jgi:hypothetical protein